MTQRAKRGRPARAKTGERSWTTISFRAAASEIKAVNEAAVREGVSRSVFILKAIEAAIATTEV